MVGRRQEQVGRKPLDEPATCTQPGADAGCRTAIKSPSTDGRLPAEEQADAGWPNQEPHAVAGAVGPPNAAAPNNRPDGQPGRRRRPGPQSTRTSRNSPRPGEDPAKPAGPARRRSAPASRCAAAAGGRRTRSARPPGACREAPDGKRQDAGLGPVGRAHAPKGVDEGTPRHHRLEKAVRQPQPAGTPPRVIASTNGYRKAISRLAVAAPPAQKKPAQDREVVAPTDRPLARRAVRARLNRLIPQRQPVDHDVQKAPHRTAHEKDEEG